MTIPVTGDIVEVAVEAEWDGTEDVVHVYQFKMGAGTLATQATWENELAVLVNALITIAKGYAQLLTVYRRYRARNITQQTPTEHFELGTPVTGSVAGDTLASGTAFLFVFRTGKPRTTLRKFFGVPSKNDLDNDGRWAIGRLVVAAADIATMIAPFSTASTTWQYGHWDALTSTFWAPNSGYAPADPAYQRRRRAGRGS